MASFTAYSRVFNFQNQQALTPTAPIPANQLDAELNAILQVTLNIVAAFDQIQRDDGALKNRSVGFDQLKAELTAGFAPPTVWASATVYTVASTVFQGTSFYRCLVRHTAGVFATDLAAAKWAFVFDFEDIFAQLAADIAIDGWSPEFAVETDGARRVLKVVDWTGGDGEKPAVDVYVGASGFTAVLANAVDIRGGTGATGDTGDAGATGAAGTDGEKWFNGSADPGAGTGAIGDLYLQTGTGATGVLGDVWEKAAGAWSIIVNIRGASGAGTGDVVGPDGGVVADEIPVFSDTTGKEIVGSGVSIDDLYTSAEVDTLLADYLTTAAAAAAYQPLDADLTAIAALTTTAFGRGFLAYADEAAFKAGANLEANTDFYAPGGTDVAIADGGTGAGTAAAAFDNLKQAATTTAPGVVEEATDAEVRAATDGKFLDAAHIETSSAYVALTETAGAVAVNWDAFINGSVTVDQATVISNPTNGQPGTYRSVLVQGNDTTDRAITFGNQYLGDLPTIADCDSTRWYDLTIKCITATHFTVVAMVAKKP